MKLYNTLTNQKQEFVPMDKSSVKIYSCGPTVYNYLHIGNARQAVTFDTLRRYLAYRGYGVKFVQNFTDVDDKMINKAREQGITVKELGERYITEYFTDADGMGIARADVHPKATENIPAIIKLVETLIDKGYAYNKDGDVYFSTKKFAGYGKLSHQPLDELESGARISINEDKDDPMDFAVWKKKKPGEVAWDSPWGEGRPGWHIECSAMANEFLGETLDIHSGGQDLIFPHHENEIAQSEAANGVPFANYWVHNGYINVDNKKMSKSEGNFFTIREIAEEFGYEVIRFFILSVHYRSPVNFSKELMRASKAGLERIYNCVNNLEFLRENHSADNNEVGGTEYIQSINNLKQKYLTAMDDDLNTADAIAAVFEIVALANKSDLDVNSIDFTLNAIQELCGVLGLLSKIKESLPDEVQSLLDQRAEARANKEWAK